MKIIVFRTKGVVRKKRKAVVLVAGCLSLFLANKYRNGKYIYIEIEDFLSAIKW